ncbi:MAG: recombination protein RecR [Parcubacteria group bacterium]|nr:recombination protein RecR [Parcubacteria group bacterium]
MFPVPIQKLIAHFQKLPGIGPRQAARFALRLSRMSEPELKTMAEDIAGLKKIIGQCRECGLLFEPSAGGEVLCRFCRDGSRDPGKICVVASDHDALAIEKTKTFSGRYHILGGHVSLLDKPENQNLNSARLLERLKNGVELEVILALNATTEGQATALYLEKIIQTSYPQTKITRLGQGLSTGSEIEYTDEQTLINALKNRQ